MVLLTSWDLDRKRHVVGACHFVAPVKRDLMLSSIFFSSDVLNELTSQAWTWIQFIQAFFCLKQKGDRTNVDQTLPCGGGLKGSDRYISVRQWGGLERYQTPYTTMSTNRHLTLSFYFQVKRALGLQVLLHSI